MGNHKSSTSTKIFGLALMDLESSMGTWILSKRTDTGSWSTEARTENLVIVHGLLVPQLKFMKAKPKASMLVLGSLYLGVGL